MSAQDPNQRLLAIIDEQRKTQTPEELLAFVIQLYGAEFIKANNEIAHLREANENLFKIKQKVVIANRELVRRVAHFDQRDKDRASIITAAVAFCDAHKEDYELMRTSESMDIDTCFMILCQAVEAERVKAEDTPA